MDSRGYDRIVQSLNKLRDQYTQQIHRPMFAITTTTGPNIRVWPIPEPDQDVPFLSVLSEELVPPAAIANALHEDGLMLMSTDDSIVEGPQLRLESAVPGCVTFSDINAASSALKNQLDSRFD